MSNQNVPCQRTGDDRGGAPAENTNALTTGHRQAQVALEKDAPFSGLALAKQQEIQDRIHNDGLAVELHHRATRISAVADLIFDALCAKWVELSLEQKMRLADSYGRFDARAVKALKDAGELDAHRPERQFPDIVDVEIRENGNG